MKQNINVLLKIWKQITLKQLKDAQALIEYSNTMQDVYKNIEGYNPSRKCNVLMVFDDMVAAMINKKLNPSVTELYIKGRKLNCFQGNRPGAADTHLH